MNLYQIQVFVTTEDEAINYGLFNLALFIVAANRAPWTPQAKCSEGKGSARVSVLAELKFSHRWEFLFTLDDAASHSQMCVCMCVCKSQNSTRIFNDHAMLIVHSMLSIKDNILIL